MFWIRANCRKVVYQMPGAGGLLMGGDGLSADLSPYENKVQCVYLDPPFFTGERFPYRMRVGEAGWKKNAKAVELTAYDDFSGKSRGEYALFLKAAAQRAHSLLKDEGLFFLHVDYRATATARLMLDEVFGENNFLNEIIWSYQTGGRSKRYFSRKHDTILMYAKTPEYYFNLEAVPHMKKKDRQNHMKRMVDENGRTYRSIRSGGKTYVYYDDEPAYPDDVWTDISQMQQRDPERTGYPTQKPEALLERIILCSTREKDIVADFMCGAGTALTCAARLKRVFLGVDSSPYAIAAVSKRLRGASAQIVSPLSPVNAMVDAGVMPGIGFYDVSLNAYTLPPSAFSDVQLAPAGAEIGGLDAVDQWYAGLINGETFNVFASSVRTKKTPALQGTLQVPLLRGTVALMVVDVLGNRTLWSATHG